MDLGTGDGGDGGGADAAGCATSATCADSTPICASSTCRACASASDDDQCQIHNVATPICDPVAGACRACKTHSECPAGVCASDGSCVPVSNIAYVNSGAAGCPSTGTHDGLSPATPFCDLPPAVAGTQPFILVHDGLYTPVTVARAATIVGPGIAGISNYATIQPPGGASVALTFAATTSVTLTIDGLNFIGSVVCTGGAAQTLVVKNSQVTSAPLNAFGVLAGNCNIDLIANDIVNNTAGGVKLGTGTAHLLNNRISDNRVVATDGTSGWGVFDNDPGNLTLESNYISGNQSGGVFIEAGAWSLINNYLVVNFGNAGAILNSPGGTFRFNTVVGNPEGIECNGGNVAIESSIIWHNPMAGGQTFNGGCMRTNVVVGSDQTAFAGDVALDPSFILGGEYKLDPTSALNTACCVDKVPMAVGFPDHDFFGNHRPLGAAFDIGAHELK